MKVKKLMKILKTCPPDAEVKLHHFTGPNLLFVCQMVNKDIVYLEDASSNDLGSELDARFEGLLGKKMTEQEFFTDLVDTGFHLEDIKTYLPEKYEYSKEVTEKYGLTW